MVSPPPEATGVPMATKLRTPGEYKGRCSMGSMRRSYDGNMRRSCDGGGGRASPGCAEVSYGEVTSSRFDFSSATLGHQSAMIGGEPVCAAPTRQHLGGHIRVAVRVRPLPGGEDGIIEVAGTNAIAIRKDAATGGNQFLLSQQGRVEEREFDRVFGPCATQNEVYDCTCQPLISEAVATGRNATVFVYGATGAGKTHTMFGSNTSPDERGIIFRAIVEVFERLDEIGGMAFGHFEVKVSFLEIYNEVVRDLLQVQDGSDGQSTCRVLEDAQKGVVKVSNLLEVPIRRPEDALRLLQAGMVARTVEATAANRESSRAHAVFTLSVEQVQEQAPTGIFQRKSAQVRTLHSKIALIDLAGSERAKETQNSGAALKDGARINQSLLALANCIDALTQRGPTTRKKAPYRDSKLTLMLKNSLTGDGLVAMIANVHPGRNHFEDSNNTLEYAKRASVVRATVGRRLSNFPSGNTLGSQALSPPPRKANGHDSTRVHCSNAPSSRGSVAHGMDHASIAASAVAVAGEACSGIRRRKNVKPSHMKLLDHAASGTEPTSASSPEDCLSEISLSVAGAESEPSPSGGSRGSPTNEPDRFEADEHVLQITPQPQDSMSDDESREDPSSRVECRPWDSLPVTPGEAATAIERGHAPAVAVQSNESVGVSEVERSLVARIVSTLQSEKADLNAKLNSVFRERDSLFEVCRALEDENERLRATSSEKDSLIAELLSARGCGRSGA